MSGMERETLPRNVVQQAIQTIKTQGPTPITPGEMRSDGGVALCAAAALAAAGLKHARLPERLKQFEEEIVAAKSKDSIRRVFAELGWPVALCERSMAKNDGFASTVRREGVLQYLQSLAAS